MLVQTIRKSNQHEVIGSNLVNGGRCRAFHAVFMTVNYFVSTDFGIQTENV